MATKLRPGTFLGQTPRAIAIGGLTFAETSYAAKWELELPAHSHEDAFLHLMVEGACEEVCGRRRRLREVGALAFHPVGEVHSNRWHGGGGRVFHVDLSRSRAQSIREYASGLDRPVELRDGVGPWLAARLYREYRRPEGPSPLALEGLALELLAEASRDGTPDPERTAPRWLLRARDLLHDRFREELTLAEVAEAVGVHPVHLARTFRRLLGRTPGVYLRRLRVEFACRMLATTDRPLAEIALDSGFADQSHFTRTFRGQMNMTPGEFRRNFRPR